jgi:putative hydrolase of HD superfamily
MTESHRNDGEAPSSMPAYARLLLLAGALKNLPRTGWLLAGIKYCESVAEHSYRVTLVALVLSELVQGVNRDKLLQMALLHDLPESLVTDLPRGTVQLVSRDAKQRAERDAWATLMPLDPPLKRWRSLWEEFEAGQSAEAKLVRAADRLEMLFQAFEYEQTGYTNLTSFWEDESLADSEFEGVRALFAEVKRLRSALAGTSQFRED